MRVEFEVTGAKEAAHKMRGFASRIEEPAGPLLESIAAALETGFRENFERQGSALGGPWVPLAPFTQRMRKWKGFNPEGPILVRTHDLQQSIRLLTQDENSVTVGTDLEYAAVLQFGGEEDSDEDVPGVRTIPARPFVVLSPELIEEALDLVHGYYFEDGPDA
jgi:phage virion morphogenesis protein